MPLLFLLTSLLIILSIKMIRLIQFEISFLKLIFSILYMYTYFGINFFFISAIGCSKIGEDYYYISDLTIDCND
jgi:hypothetical protein